MKWRPRADWKRGRFPTDLRLFSDGLSGASLVLRCTYRPGGPRVGIRTQKLVGGPGFEPGASRSRTVSAPCPRVSWRLLLGLLTSNAVGFVSFCYLAEPSVSGNARSSSAPA